MLPAPPVKMRPKLPANQRAASENKKPKLKAFVVHFKQLVLGPPTGGCPNQIVLLGRSPAPHGLFPPTLSDSQFIT